MWRRFLPAAQFANANPLLDDVAIALDDGRRELWCAAVPHQYWTKKHRNYRFKEREGSRTGGLGSGMLARRRDGAIVLRLSSTRGRLMRLRGSDVSVTVRVGERCATGAVQLRRAEDGSLIFP